MTRKNPQNPPYALRSVEVLAFPQVQLLDVAGPLQVFTTANEQLAARGRPPAYAARVVAPDGLRVRATAGLDMVADPLPAPDGALDTLVVAGGQGVLRATESTALVDWVARRAERARRVASVCTGAFLLAAAGLLDGRRAVTHWRYCDRLARLHPRVRVEPDPIFVRDGDVWTSAGVTAGIDLALALVENDLGRQLALAVARDLVVFLKRPGGQAQFSTTLILQGSDERFAALHQWIGDHLAEALPVRRLAEQAAMSERSFLRHYRDATGMTPAHAVERLRVEAARHLLSETRLPLKRVALRCGFGSEETLRRSFVRLQGAGPRDYRERFGALPSGGAAQA